MLSISGWIARMAAFGLAVLTGMAAIIAYWAWTLRDERDTWFVVYAGDAEVLGEEILFGAIAVAAFCGILASLLSWLSLKPPRAAQ